MSTFQTVVLGIFGFFIIAGLLAISLTKGQGGEQAVTLTMWGALPAAQFQELSKDFFPERGTL
ncbi:MAG: hypothetical protein Q7R88_03250, partial [bacterium]|nr:hypothetical protein [bacterium]